jgi:hypothetical protein
MELVTKFLKHLGFKEFNGTRLERIFQGTCSFSLLTKEWIPFNDQYEFPLSIYTSFKYIVKTDIDINTIGIGSMSDNLFQSNSNDTPSTNTESMQGVEYRYPILVFELDQLYSLETQVEEFTSKWQQRNWMCLLFDYCIMWITSPKLYKSVQYMSEWAHADPKQESNPSKWNKPIVFETKVVESFVTDQDYLVDSLLLDRIRENPFELLL